MTTFTIPLWSYLKQLFLELLHFEGSALNDTSDNVQVKIDFFPSPEEENASKELERLKREVFHAEDPTPTPENKTSTWATNKFAGLMTPETFRGFIHGRCPGIRIRELIESEEAAKITKDIAGLVEEYKTAPGVGRAGVTAVEYPNDFDGYAELSAILSDPKISIPHRLELADKIIMFLTRHTRGYQINPLNYNGSEMFWGLFRELTAGAGWHLDNVAEDMVVFHNRKVAFQFSAVLHIKTPQKGGETIIADRRAQEGDKEFLNPSPNDWTYKNKLFNGVVKAEIPAITGDLNFLSTVNYHMVNPCLEKDAERISFSMFFVVFEDELNTIYYYN